MPPRATSVTTPSLHYWRTRKALLQRELAERAHVDLTTVQRLERGLSSRLHTVRTLAEALGVQPADLMGKPPSS